ncbi:MAG: hypothetical protein JRC69_04230 [Deltaproteobacteria bacterium]|nr:hypothetical protein [Deltaproteobacteria bacterium]
MNLKLLKKHTVVMCGFCFVLLIGGCASFSDKPKNVILQNPETMEFVNCEVDWRGMKDSYEANEQCVKDYQAKGYVIWGER